jgi:hypothetical protein
MALDPRVVPLLVASATSGSAEKRVSALLKLNSIGGPEADAVITGALGDEDEGVFQGALECMQERWFPRAEEALLRELEARRGTPRWVAILSAMHWHRSEPVFRAVVSAYETGSFEGISPWSIARDLLFYPCKESESVLRAIRDGADENGSERARKSLELFARIGTLDAGPCMSTTGPDRLGRELLDDAYKGTSDSRSDAVDHLGILGGEWARIAIVNLFEDPDDQVAAAAMLAARDLVFPEMETLLVGEVDARRTTSRVYFALFALTRYCSEGTFHALLRALRRGSLEDSSVTTIAGQLWKYPCDEAESALRSIVKTGGEYARARAGDSLHFIAAVRDRPPVEPAGS